MAGFSLEERRAGSYRVRSQDDADVDAYRLVGALPPQRQRLFLFAHLKEARLVDDEAFAREIATATGEDVVGVGRALKADRGSEPLSTIWFDTPPEDGVLWTEEGPLRFRLETKDVLNPGLFLDQRENRVRLSALCRDAIAQTGAPESVSVLNLFSYTGSFSLAARAGGATRTTSVDVSARYLAWERKNFDENFPGADPPRLIRADARDFLRRARKRGDQYRFIVIDPPTFSRGDGKPFRVASELPRLAEDALACLSRDAPSAVFVSTNDAGWSNEEFLVAMERVARAGSATLSEGTTPSDFGPDHPLKSAWLSRS
jgi:23S rRNA (cytosine1962-C5)-methyltransferase